MVVLVEYCMQGQILLYTLLEKLNNICCNIIVVKFYLENI